MEKIFLSKYVWKKNVRKLLIHFKITENLDLLCPTNLFCPYKEKSEMTLQQLTNSFITHHQRLYTLIDIYKTMKKIRIIIRIVIQLSSLLTKNVGTDKQKNVGHGARIFSCNIFWSNCF